MLWLSQLLLWAAVLVLSLAVLALARQIGILHERVAPAGALAMDRGPKVGEPGPVFELPDFAGRLVKLGGVNPRGKATLLVFVSPKCPVCKKLMPAVRSLAARERAWLELVLVSDGERKEHEALIRASGLESAAYIVSAEVGRAYQIGKVPYAVLLDPVGKVRAKGLVNTREHVESLLQAHELGVGSLQDYLASQTQR